MLLDRQTIVSALEEVVVVVVYYVFVLSSRHTKFHALLLRMNALWRVTWRDADLIESR